MKKNFQVQITLVISLMLFMSQDLLAQSKKLPEKKTKTNSQDLAQPAAESNSTSGTLKFNTDVELNKAEIREPINFKYEPEKKQTEINSDEIAAEDTSFKAYPGYPKHRVKLNLTPTMVASKFTYGGANFNFNSNSNSALGFAYEYQSTPMLNFALEYSRYEVAVKAGAFQGGIIKESKSTVDNYGIKSQYCQIMQGNFFQQLCFGADFGVESYGLLDFYNSTDLAMSKVQDIIVGINIGYNHPLFSGILLKTKLGYNYGTGAGNSGELSTASNNSLYFNADFEWMWRQHHGFTVGAEYKNRNATVKGLRGTNDDKWKSTITTTAGKFGYIYSF